MYKTIKNIGKFEQTITKSRFIARAVHVETEEEAMLFVSDEKKRCCDSRHCCWAYILGDNSETMRYSDDGEPQGTAGLPMLEALRKKELTYTLVTVVRYFGGVLLGTGGLTRAYSSSACGAIDDAVIAKMELSQRFFLTVDYTFNSRVKNFLEKQEAIIDKTEYSDKVTLTLTVKKEAFAEIKENIENLLNGKCLINESETLWFPWE